MATNTAPRRFFLALDGDTVWGMGGDGESAIADARRWFVDVVGDEDGDEAIAGMAIYEVGAACARAVQAGNVSVRALGIVVDTHRRHNTIRSVAGGWTAREAAARLRRECASFTV